MQFTSFIQDLLEKGQVTVARQLNPFSEEDLQEAGVVLRKYYTDDALEMPYTAPGFSAEAAIWGATYLYRASQFIMLRDVGEQEVHAHLSDFSGVISPEAIYSADLTLRYLPELLYLAKGLAPDDILVKCIKHRLVQWPFSSVGTEVAREVNHQPILAHPSLKYAYIDRIIQQKDIKRATDEAIAEAIREALGAHSSVLWPEFNQTKIA
jgi:hypothetical protein